jgi:hypothetical protein
MADWQWHEALQMQHIEQENHFWEFQYQHNIFQIENIRYTQLERKKTPETDLTLSRLYEISLITYIQTINTVTEHPLNSIIVDAFHQTMRHDLIQKAIHTYIASNVRLTHLTEFFLQELQKKPKNSDILAYHGFFWITEILMMSYYNVYIYDQDFQNTAPSVIVSLVFDILQKYHLQYNTAQPETIFNEFQIENKIYRYVDRRIHFTKTVIDSIYNCIVRRQTQILDTTCANRRSDPNSRLTAPGHPSGAADVLMPTARAWTFPRNPRGLPEGGSSLQFP